jgi:hypothetical protein
MLVRKLEVKSLFHQSICQLLIGCLIFSTFDPASRVHGQIVSQFATIGPEAPAILSELVGEDHILRVPAGQQFDVLKHHRITALIAPEEWLDEGELANIRALDVPVIRIKRHTTIANILDNIRTLAALTRTESAGNDWIKGIEQGIKSFKARTLGLKPTRVLTLTPEGYTEGQGTLVTELITITGGINTAAEAGIPEARQIDDAQIRLFAPEVILLINWTADDAADFAHNTLLGEVPAFRKHHLYRQVSFGKDPAQLLTDLQRLLDLLHPTLL